MGNLADKVSASLKVWVAQVIINSGGWVRTGFHSPYTTGTYPEMSSHQALKSYFEERKSQGVRASGCFSPCICAGVFVPQTLAAEASEVSPTVLAFPPPRDTHKHSECNQPIEMILPIYTSQRRNQIADILASRGIMMRFWITRQP